MENFFGAPGIKILKGSPYEFKNLKMIEENFLKKYL
jgi:hypothetical protein